PLGGRWSRFIVTVGGPSCRSGSFVEGSPRPWGFSASCFLSMKTTVTNSPRLEPTFPRGRHRDLRCARGSTSRLGRHGSSRSGRCASRAESFRAPHEDFNGEAFLIVPG